MTKLLLPVSILFLFLAGTANADGCNAACSFIEDQTGEDCEEVAEMISEIGDNCGGNATCIINQTAVASEGEWSAENAKDFYLRLDDFECFNEL